MRKSFQKKVSDEVLRANIEFKFNVVRFFGVDFQRAAKILAKKFAGFASRADCRIKEFIHNGLTIYASTLMSSRCRSIGFVPLNDDFHVVWGSEFEIELRKKLTMQQILIDDVMNVR